MAMIKRKTFVGPLVYFGREFSGCGSLTACRDVIRDRAQAFINEIAGPENVVSVTEHAMTFGPFSVVVWYHDRGQKPRPFESMDELE
jgi:hypothetical protein